MSARSASRAASAAQRSGAVRSGAAALPCRDLRGRSEDFDADALVFSFSLALAPSRYFQIIMWRRRHRRRHGPGGAVLKFYDAAQHRTGKRLNLLGSMVPFQALTRDVRAGVGARVCMEITQNYRIIEPGLRNGRNEPFLEGRAVLCRFYSSARIKISGGYASFVFAAAIVPDQRLVGGSGGRNFWGRRGRAGGAIGRAGRIQLRGGIGGFPGVSRGRSGLVGMAMSEWHWQAVENTAFYRFVRKPSRLRSARWARGGAIAAGRGVPPPSAARPFPRALALPFFRVSIDLAYRGIGATWLGERFGQSNGCARRGSGARAPSGSVGRGHESGRSIEAGRVGDDVVSGAAWGPGRERGKLWGGCARVNA